MINTESRPDVRDDRLRDTYADWTLLARGARGTSWRATHVATGAPVLVKVRPCSPQTEVMVRREAEAMHSVVSPYLQRFQTMFANEDQLCLIYDFVEGRSLRERLDDGPLMWPEAVTILRSVLQGLGALHARGLIHRDVSPENIVLRERRGDAVLIDFDAFGRLEAKTRIGETTVGVQFAGKLAYMSPEQLAGAPQSAAVDVWGAGAVLFECLSGRRLQEGMSAHEIVGLSAQPLDLTGAAPLFHPILGRMLAVDPAARPNVDAVLAELDTLLDRVAVQSDDWVAPSPDPAPKPASPAPMATPKRRGLPVWVTVLILLGLGAGAIVFLGWGGGIRTGNPGEPLVDADTMRGVVFVALGLTVAGLGFIVAGAFRARARTTELALPFQAIDLIQAPDARSRLSETICMGIDAYRAMAGPASEEMLTVTMVALAKEYAEAETADTRLKALTMLNELHSQISRSLRPWWLNHEKVIATGISLTSLVAGAVAAMQGVRGLF